MRLQLSRSWYEREVQKDASCPVLSVGAGHPNLEASAPEASLTPYSFVTRDGAGLAFGRLINFKRRNLGWTLEKLAEQADVDLEELINIEHEEGDSPEPRTVYNLAAALALPAKKLMTLSGLAQEDDRRVKEAALRFAARSESVELLTATERDALEEFVKFLND